MDREIWFPTLLVTSKVTISSASPYGSGRRRTPWTSVKMAVAPPIPRARVATTRAA
jgi:hypothetical protein